jgi:hypothetical protein
MHSMSMWFCLHIGSLHSMEDMPNIQLESTLSINPFIIFYFEINIF